MDNSKEFKLLLEGLNCANCANKIEVKVNELEEVKEANLNFTTSTLIIEMNLNFSKSSVIDKVVSIVTELEPDVKVSEKSIVKKASNDKQDIESNTDFKLLLSGLDCANCANKIECLVNNIKGVREANLNFSTSTLIIEMSGTCSKKVLVEEITSIVNKLEPHVEITEKLSSNKIRCEVKEGCCKDDSCSMDIDRKLQGDESVRKDNEQKSIIKENFRLIIGGIIFALGFAVPEKTIFNEILFTLSYVLIGGNVVKIAIRNILRGEVFDENFLMTIATIGAFIIGEFPEAVAVMLFYEVGERFQAHAVKRSRKSISSLMNIRADYANVIRHNEEIKVAPETVSINDIIIVKPGERIPLDGTVIEGVGFIDTSALTGESVPREINIGDDILAGCINTNSVLRVKVTKEFGESTVSRILELVENASNKKAPTEKFITKFSKKYTPIVVISSLLLAILPPLLIEGANFQDWLYRACVFLVISCPCALVVSIPLGLFSGIGGASKRGVLVKGGNYLEALKNVEVIVFDKTGTLTKGVFRVTEINENNINKGELLEIAALGESLSNHPIAQSIVNEYKNDINKDIITDYKEISGHGIEVIIRGEKVLLGNHKLMDMFNIKYKPIDTIGTVVHVAINNEYKGNIVISDEIKESSIEAIKGLKEIGIKKTVMLTGDNKNVADKVAKTLGLDQVYSELLPEDKVIKIEELIKKNNKKTNVAFVGDGINDAPVLARADIGIAMGGIGSDAAIEAADVVLMRDDPESLIDAIKIARKTNKILWQNIIFSIGIKVFVLMLGAFGIATMWEAVFADVGVTIIAILNSSRCLK